MVVLQIHIVTISIEPFLAKCRWMLNTNTVFWRVVINPTQKNHFLEPNGKLKWNRYTFHLIEYLVIFKH